MRSSIKPKIEAAEAYQDLGDDPLKDPRVKHELMKFRIATRIRDGVEDLRD
jgi:hypothetical protein